MIIANHCPDLDFCAFLKWKKNVWYNGQIHRPICTCCHVPWIDDSLHEWISQSKAIGLYASSNGDVRLGVSDSSICYHIDKKVQVIFSYHS